MANNKSPGSDGFTTEFYKVFWNRIGHFVVRSLNYGYTIGEFSVTQKQGIITCIPKEGKSKYFLKNWRPITLLNVAYKIGSGCIAKRIKNILDIIISPDQTGFIPGRYIGENTRLIYDIMQYTEENNIPGVLLMIDFEKAFDTVSWKFIHKCLEFFNFGPTIQSWIATFQYNIESSVTQAGYLSKFFKPGRGCRQGDPISPYLFLLCAEILAYKIKGNQNIHGVQIDDIEYLMSQYADDTAVILDGSEKSLKATIDELNNFNAISGLKINLSKTQLVWIGSKKYSNEILCHEMNFHWTTQFKLLGIHFDVDLTNIPKLNYDKKLVKIKEIIKQWNKRHITPIGKITLIKSLMISQMNHLFISLPTPSNKFIKDLNSILYGFLWNSKIDKIKRKQITQKYSQGGLKMIDINNYIQGLKSSWIKRSLNDENAKWKKLLNKSINTELILKTGSDYINKKLHLLKNSFWKDTFIAFQNIQDKMKIHTWEDFISQPIWNNKNILIGKTSPFFREWFNKNIIYINDLLDDKGSFLDLQTFISRFNIKTDFLTYLSLKNSIIASMINHKIAKKEVNNKPFIPVHIQIFCSPKKGTKAMYDTLNCAENVSSFYKPKWEVYFKLSELEWKTIMQLPFINTRSAKLQWLQFRINHHILTTNTFLFKIGLKDNNLCSFCNTHEETIYHVLWECPKVQELFNAFCYYCQTRGFIISRNSLEFIFGLNPNHTASETYYIFLICKSYTYRKRCLNEKLSIQGLLIDIKTHISTLKYIATKNCELDIFNNKWETWINIINS